MKKSIRFCSTHSTMMILINTGLVGALLLGAGKEVYGGVGQPEVIADSAVLEASTIRGDRDAVPEGLTNSEWGRITASIERDRYRIQKDEHTGWYEAPNSAHRLDATFTPGGLIVSPHQEDKAWIWGLSLNRCGYGSDLHAVAAVEKMIAEDNRIEYHRGNMVEWYTNDQRGIEQGFTLKTRPSGRPDSGFLQLQMVTTTNLMPRVEKDGRGIVFSNVKGEEVIRYSGLYVYDAAGEKISARMEADQEGIRLIVADHEAVYPITIDPFVERKKLLASDGAASDWFGRSVSVSGDTAIVGAAYDDDNGSDSGSAFIFSRDEGGADNWGFVKKLTASDAAALDRFGDSVSIDGDTAIVGAPLNDGSVINIGSAYIFSRNQGGADNWGEVEKLTAGDAYYLFGGSVSISGDTAIVGASGDDDNGSFSGSAYVFYRNQGGADNWGQVRKITANDANNYHYFGVSVSVSGDSVIVGAYGDDDNGTGSGAAYIFYRDQGGADNWGQVKKITAFDGEADDRFGYSVSISGDTCVAGAHLGDFNGTGSGSAYLYTRDEGGVDNWGGVKVIDASDGASEDNFGWSVSISGDTVVIGAYLDDHTWPNAGSAYIFSRNQGGLENWGEVDKLTASDAATGDAFGYGVSISGGTTIVGAAYDDDQGGDSGSAYVFVDFIIFANDFESDDTK